ncbi:hypothetical protein [Flavonifractor sp. An306]|uniref:hypothetical protein n=1 Tax=Flavonifractor sp. An306 TaxID=1965629 RepID=UPI000B39709B|nr:hypothetical protein [Flavonifractor sp. An306]OUO43791.1 hypothetical protein B5F88_02310 [Flavonifractor sp. An306]
MGYRFGWAFLSEVEEDPDLVSLKLKRGGPMALIANDKVLAVMLSENGYQALLEKERPQWTPAARCARLAILSAAGLRT